MPTLLATLAPPAEGACGFFSPLNWAAALPAEVPADVVVLMGAFSALFLVVRLVLVVCCWKAGHVVAEALPPPHDAAAEIAALRRQLDVVSTQVDLCLVRLERQAKKGAGFFVKPAGTKLHLANDCPRVQAGKDNVELHWVSDEFADWLLRSGVCCTHCLQRELILSSE